MGDAGGKWLVPAMLLLLLTPISSAISSGGYGSPCTLCKMTEIYMFENQSTVHAALIAMNINIPEGRTEEENEMLRNVYEQALHEDYTITLVGSRQTANVSLLVNQPVYFTYDSYSYDAMKGAVVSTRTQIYGCYPAMTDENGTASCTIDYSVYKGRCTNIYASYRGTNDHNPASRFIVMCDRDATGFSAMASSISMLSAGQPLCLLASIILGLLLASMFFSGRSPLMLLDITTPLLPKPKSISFSGLSFGTGYVRMMKEIKMAQKLTASHLGIQAQLLSKQMLRNGFSADAIRRIMKFVKENPAMAYLALRALKDGKPISEVMRIANLFGPAAEKDRKRMEADLAEAGKALNDLEKKGKDAGLDAVWLHIASKQQASLLAKITGGLTPRQAKIRDILIDNPLMKLMMPERIRDQLKVGVGSAFFGVKTTRDMAKAAAKTMGRAAAEAVGSAIGRPTTLFAPTAKEIEAGRARLMEIRKRISQLYEMQMQEAKANAAMYLVKKMLESRGVSMRLSHDELLRLGEDIEIIQRMNLKNNPKAEALDRKIREILSGPGSMDEKIMRFMALADAEKCSYDRRGVSSFLKKLNLINNNTLLSDHSKLQLLHEYLRDHNKNNPLGSEGFYIWSNRDSLRIVSGNTTKLDDTWTFLYLREYMDQSKAATAADVAKLQWVRLVNEMWGLVPSNTKGLPAANRQMMKRAEDYLASLLTEAGSRLKNKMANVFSLLYNPELPGMRIFAAGEGAREYGANPDHWKVNMRGYWRVYSPGSNLAKTCVMEQAHGAIFRSHISHPVISEIRRENPGMKQEKVLELARERVAAQMFYNRIRSMVGSRYPDAYYTANSEYAFVNSVYGAYRERFAQMYGKQLGKNPSNYSWVTDKDVEALIKRGISKEDMYNFVWIRTREGSYIPFTEGREALALRVSDGESIINGRLTVNMQGRWVEFKPSAIEKKMMEPGNQLSKDLAEYRIAIMDALSAAPRVAEGMFPKKDLSAMVNYKGRQVELRQLIDEFGRMAKQWGESGNRQDIAALVLLNICKDARYFAPLEETRLLSIRPVKDTEFIGFSKLTQKIAQPFSKGIQSVLVSGIMPQINDIQSFVMHSEYFRARAAEFSYRISLDPAATDPRINRELSKNVSDLVDNLSRYRAVWDMTITRDPRGNSSAIGQQANFASLYHHGPALHPVPSAVLGQMTGRGFAKMMESFRLMPLALNWTVGAPMILMTRSALTSWMGYPSKHDKSYHPLQPYNMTSSRSLDGFRALFDPFYAALDFTSGSFRKVGSMLTAPLWGLTQPIRYTLEAVQSVVDRIAPPHSTVSGEKGAFQKVSSILGTPEEWMFHSRPDFFMPYYLREAGIHEKLTGPMTMREYGGKSIQDGVVRTHEDHAWLYKNINVVWNVNTNPGVSYVDFYYNVRADPRLATHLVSASPYKSFFAQDEYLQKQANLGMVHREASPYELAAIREDELRQYSSLFRNRMLGLMNPAFFFINNPLPGLSFLSVMGLKHQWDRWRNIFEKMEARKELRTKDIHAMPTTGMLGQPLAGVSSQLQYTTLQPNEAAKAEHIAEKFIRKTGYIFSSVFLDKQFIACGACGSPMERGGVCPVCSGKSLYLLRFRKWANYRRRTPAPGGTT